MAKHAWGCAVGIIPTADHTRVMLCSPGDRRPVGLSCANRGPKMARLADINATSSMPCADAAPGRSASAKTPTSAIIGRRASVLDSFVRHRIAQDLDGRAVAGLRRAGKGRNIGREEKVGSPTESEAPPADGYYPEGEWHIRPPLRCQHRKTKPLYTASQPPVPRYRRKADPLRPPTLGWREA
jgi:hypothetical protein